MSASVFVTGGTGYLGRSLIPVLLRRGHRVRALVRRGSDRRLPPGCEALSGNVLDATTFASAVRPNDTFVHLVGTPRPSPAKARQFREVDLASAREAVTAAAAAHVRHFVYVSVAHPAPVMRAYIAARTEAEALLFDSGVPATVLRPWYVLGPGHRWPLALVPLYWLLERLPATRNDALRLGLVTLDQMTWALAFAVENPPPRTRILAVPEIRVSALTALRGQSASGGPTTGVD